jgi:hypothetical protein
MTENEGRMSRRRFVRRLGLTLGAGIGLMAIPARALAIPFRCCYSGCACGHDNCATGKCRCLCDCGGSSYCAINCVSPGQCINCPC